MLEEIIMETEMTIKKHNKIYAFMYGFREENPDHIIDIDINKLNFPSTGRYMVYIWGGPGPDYNIYHFRDYGKTWAYTKEELL